MPDYFNDGPENTGTKAPAATTEKEPSGDEQTFVLPKSIAGGKKFQPGDEMVVEIVAEHENSFEVKYAPEAKSEEPATEPETEPEEENEPESEMPMKGEMDSMME